MACVSGLKSELLRTEKRAEHVVRLAIGLFLRSERMDFVSVVE